MWTMGATVTFTVDDASWMVHSKKLPKLSQNIEAHRVNLV